MAKGLLLGRSALWDATLQQPHPGVPEAIAECAKVSTPFLVSNHDQPAWLHTHYRMVKFQGAAARQTGDVVQGLIEANPRLNLLPGDFIVVGSEVEDLQMAANGGAALLTPSWTNDSAKYGIRVSSPEQLPRLIRYFIEASEPWYFRSEHDPTFQVFALTNGGSYDQPSEGAEALSQQLRRHLKDGVHENPFVLLHLLSSLHRTTCMLEAGRDCMWAYFPGSEPDPSDNSQMARYAHRARQTLAQSRKLAKQGEPLIIRHRATAKRHVGGTDRFDPGPQLESLHLNPKYKRQVRGRTVYVVDDFLTKGLSFGVAEALLRRAGAKAVVAVAMGAFGKSPQRFDITVTGDPFRVLTAKDYSAKGYAPLLGDWRGQAQIDFYEKFTK